ncbi:MULTISPECIES: [FeFe] hydrogenase H-cluster maturation GTPase HydF [unclassified Ruminococcus]|uniref:[FeFe] hydrogenase H-cluster maturation GTPase HydF n=1 Tax=unclassified Ruminococcus TaxID=2608920 RepID=UPI00210ECEAE|nr:[FeFe] hydrogenase H-cluster maturation GTPase HydF [Ruminococcus sp. zg-924]MCQ4115614.1 [FeFe] hydrogenase H-cluster maturation GTPase HydF [Ruminococcus sp. zg-921]
MSLNETPRGTRLHIGLFGKRNSGKSSLTNALTNQQISVVSDVAGTTTDPVYKSMEIHGIGPVVFIDTAGFDDEGELGNKRISQTKNALDKTDIALLIFSCAPDNSEKQWVRLLSQQNIPFIPVINKTDVLENVSEIKDEVESLCKKDAISVSAKTGEGIDSLRKALVSSVPDDFGERTITGDLCADGDLVLLVMPQDIQAPKGRLILPQVQTMRELLDKKCLVMSCTTDRLEQTLAALSKAPKLIITDSQVFKTVYEKKPEESRLTSFSTLFAKYKGDIDYFVNSTSVFESLNENSKILIAEACTHVPLKEDIGREKLPRMLKARYGQGLHIDNVNGQNFPKDLTGYDLVIQCGACMFNRRYVMSRVESAKSQGVPMSNYGVVIAYLTGILDKVDY